jgi:porin
MSSSSWLRAAVLAAVVAPAALAEEDEAASAPRYGGDLAARPALTGDWGGLREDWARGGFTLGLDATYTFQGVPSGGRDGPAFRAFSDEQDTGHTVSTNLALALDTGKAGLWPGGTVDAAAQARAGRSVVERAGSLAPVNNDALFPNVVDRFDEGAAAITALTYTQSFDGKFSLYGGLLDNAEGDENEIAGSALSNAHFLNAALTYSAVEDASVPHVSLGGGVLFEPSDSFSSSLGVFGTSERAGENPFKDWNGTTFAFECTLADTVAERGGAQTVGVLYAVNARRTDIAADPRLVLGSVLRGQPVPSTQRDTWAIYYNAHHFLIGDEEAGLGVFTRFGLSDGDPNPVRWNGAGGLGGAGLIPGRKGDRCGLGAFYLDVSGEDLLRGLRVDDEWGAELFYNVAVTAWLHVTADAQVVEPGLPRADTAWVFGLRTHVNF